MVIGKFIGIQFLVAEAGLAIAEECKRVMSG